MCNQKGLNVFESCMTSLPFRAESADAIICIASFHHLKTEDVPDVMEEHFSATKKRSIASLTKFDHLNNDDVDAIRKFREQIVQRKESKVSKENSMNVLVDIEDYSGLSIDDGILSKKEKVKNIIQDIQGTYIIQINSK